MTQASHLSTAPAHLTLAESDELLPPISLTGGLVSGQLDELIPGGLYVLTPFPTPSRFPVWVIFLRTAVAAGRICHVLVKSDPAEFLDRLKSSGWTQAQDAWMDETLRLYRMADTFAKILFRLDVDGLTTELAHWGVQQHDVLLVDAADELLSLHDLSLATPQAVKLKTWAKSVQVSVLLNFNLASNPTVKNGLIGLMDHFSGVARLRSETEGPTLILEYWQSPTGTVAERGLPLQLTTDGCGLRTGEAVIRRRQREADGLRPESSTPKEHPSVLTLPNAVTSASDAVVTPDCFTVDQVWARELQLLMRLPWRTVSSAHELRALAAPLPLVIVLLRFGPDSDLADMARDVYELRKALGGKLRLIVTESKASLRYANELMLLRLGVDTIIKREVPMDRWPALLMNAANTPASSKVASDIDVEQAIASATASHARGYLQVPDFLAEVHHALERGQVLGVPFALAVLYPNPTRSLVEVIESAEFRRQGDLLTTDGEKLHVFFYACSITKGPQVLDMVFHGNLFQVATSVEWVASEVDIEQVLGELQQHHQTQPKDWMAGQEESAAHSSDAAEPALARLEVGDTVARASVTEAISVPHISTTLEKTVKDTTHTVNETMSSRSIDDSIVEETLDSVVFVTETIPSELPLRSLGEALMGRRRLVEASNHLPHAFFEETSPPLVAENTADTLDEMATELSAPTASNVTDADVSLSEVLTDSVADAEVADAQHVSHATADQDHEIAETELIPNRSLASEEPVISIDTSPVAPPDATTIAATVSEDTDDTPKKIKAYRVTEVGPFSPPELNIFNASKKISEKNTVEEQLSSTPETIEMSDIIRRLAKSPKGINKKNSRKDF